MALQHETRHSCLSRQQPHLCVRHRVGTSCSTSWAAELCPKGMGVVAGACSLPKTGSGSARRSSTRCRPSLVRFSPTMHRSFSAPSPWNSRPRESRTKFFATGWDGCGWARGGGPSVSAASVCVLGSDPKVIRLLELPPALAALRAGLRARASHTAAQSISSQPSAAVASWQHCAPIIPPHNLDAACFLSHGWSGGCKSTRHELPAASFGLPPHR